MTEPKPQPKPNAPALKLPDPMALSRSMMQIGERSGRVMREFMTRQHISSAPPAANGTHITAAFLELTQKLMLQPQRMMEAGAALWQDYMKLWQSSAQRFMQGTPSAPVIAPEKGDKRFMDPAWSQNALFDYIKQSYLLTARWMRGMVSNVEGLDERTARKVEFYTQQFVDAMSPTNFALTNPEVLRRTAETGGENLVKGLENLLKDLERGKGELRIAMTDENAFEIGRNIANTPGKVVFQNELMQLIQYAPMTGEVKRAPFLIIPPWINKYYILDLGEKKSFARWLVKQGYTVFMISWVNPDEALAQKGFADYMLEGPLEAMRQIAALTGEPQLNILGYCLGGTLLGSLLAWLEAKKNSPETVGLPK
ncbi:MAG TPA: class I poly(R)-hydroxyalkanoic acid synthase, partial [Alphaproteobacteria bacterium]|nr:class I poly(R)-hydroxyalkanoic acid synthase [Alphaproteobacteria bacterium]